jgi:molecular chaperone GrpE (heat shock protein)
MESPDLNPDPNSEPDAGEPEQPSSGSAGTMDDMLKHLRARRYQNDEMILPLSSETAGAEHSGESNDEPLQSQPVRDGGVREIESEVEEREEFDLAGAFDELRQEVRRLGRELFKVNRTGEGNQQLFSEAIDEVRQITSVVAQIPAQYTASMREAKFEARAGVCRDLLRMVDTLEASLAAADDLLRRLEAQVPNEGFIFHLSSVRRMRESLLESVAALRQWRDGQHLLAERLRAILQTAGVRPIESIGRAFDPTFHRAVSTERRNDVAPGTIIGEELKGYMLEGKILRYTEVIVAKNE